MKQWIQVEEINTFFGEENIYIISNDININKYPFLTVGHYENNIFSPYLIIYAYINIDFIHLISEIKLWSFNTFIKKYDLTNHSILEIKDKLSNKSQGKICKLPQNYEEQSDLNDKDKNKVEDNFLFDKKEEIPKINSESLKLLKLIIFLKKIELEKNNSIKDKDMQYGFPIKIEFLNKLQKLKAYQIIDNYMNQNINIKNIFQKLNLSENNIESILEKILLEFHKGIIDEINLNKESIIEYSNFNDANKEHLTLDKNKYISIYVPNNFILLNEEIYKLFKSQFDRGYNFKKKLNYIVGDSRIFILLDEFGQKKSILVYKNNKENNYMLELDLILYFNHDEKVGLNSIMENGFKKFSDFLLFDNDMVSPIFDVNQNIIGTAYKYSEKIKDYTDLNICFDIRKMFILYSNYQKLKKKLMNHNNSNRNEFSEYYIISKDWIKEYKNYYNFDVISSEFEKSSLIQQMFNKLKDDEEISDKKLTLMIKAIPKNIINIFNESESLFKTHYKNLNEKLPHISGFDYLDNNNKKQTLFYYYDFEIIEKNVYDELFKNLTTDKWSISDRDSINYDQIWKNSRKVYCLFENNKIIIKFNDKTSDTGNKFFLYIGNLNDSFIYEPEIFFLYDYSFEEEAHIKYILHYGGFSKFCGQFQNVSTNTFELRHDNKICGIAIKRTANQLNMINNDNNNNINNNLNIVPQNNIQNNLGQIENQNINKIGVIGNPIIRNNNDNIINNNEIKNIKSIKEYFYFVPKIGLANIGSTCYMNATLQCFCQIEEFASFFKYDNHVNIVSKKFLSKGEKCLTSSFKILVEKIWPSFQPTETYYEPHEFRQKISEMSPLFQNIGANDAKDLVNFIIMTLHEELNTHFSGTNSNDNNPLNNMNNNRIITYNLFLQEYKRTFKSKISDIFYAILETETKCLNCLNIQYNCQAYFFLVFPLEEVKKYAINKLNPPTSNNMNNMKNMNNISLNNNNFNMNFNINFNMNNFSGNINNNIYPNINDNNNYRNNHRRSNSMDLYNKNGNMNMNNMMMNAGNNLVMNPNNFCMQNYNNNIFNNMMTNMNNCIMSNMGMNIMNSYNNMGNNMNNFNMNNNYNNNMPFNNSFNTPNFYNNYGGGFSPNINSVNSFNRMNSNLSNITMDNMFNIGMNQNINNINNNNISNNMKLQKLYKNIVDISDCFDYNSKTDLFTGSNQIYCNNCRKMANAHYTTNIETAPKVLVLLLNRGTGLQFKIKLEFPMELNMEKYINQKQGNTNYKLIGVITHLGESGESGHFIAHCLSPIDGQWYTYNDDIVNPIDDIKKQVVDLGMPYLLFYQRKD